MGNDNRNDSQSLFERQKAILGFRSDEGLDPKTLAEEAERMDSLELPPLELPETRKQSLKPNYWQLAALAFAASILLALIPFDFSESERLRFKGKTDISVLYKVDSELKEFHGDVPLANGIPFSVLVRSPAAFVAWHSVFNDTGKSLEDDDAVLQNSIESKSSGELSFPGSIILSGNNEGEILAVLVCPLDHKSIDVIESLSKGVTFLQDKNQVENQLGPCLHKSFRLRKKH